MILEGLTEQGAVVPVQVTDQGRLVAEGLQGPQGPPGEGVSLWLKSGSDIYYDSGYVGLGTSNVRAPFDCSIGDRGLQITAVTSGYVQLTGTQGSSSSDLRPMRIAANTLSFNTGADTGTSYTERLFIDANGNVNIDSGTLYVDAVNNRVGIGASPSAKLHVNTGTNENLWVGSLGGSGAGVYLASVNDSGSANTPLQIGSASDIRLAINGTEAARVDSSRRLLVGTVSAPGSAPAGSASCAGGVYLKSPNGSWWRIAVSDSGALSAVAA